MGRCPSRTRFRSNISLTVWCKVARLRRTLGGSSGGTWFVNFGRGWTLRDESRFLHLAEMSCVGMWRRDGALIPKRFMSPLTEYCDVDWFGNDCFKPAQSLKRLTMPLAAPMPPVPRDRQGARFFRAAS